MDSVQLQRTYLDLTTPHVADACIRLGVEVRCAPANTRPLWGGTHLSGRVNPVRHYGNVDVFLEAIDRTARGDVLVVDNRGRLDEACVGDLITLEASRAGLSGIVIWGLHRDTAELRIIRLPVFSLGALPTGPQRLGPVDTLALSSATFGEHIVTTDDFVLGDDDGVLFIRGGRPIRAKTYVSVLHAMLWVGLAAVWGLLAEEVSETEFEVAHPQSAVSVRSYWFCLSMRSSSLA